MTDWRYWITYAGKVEAETEELAKLTALGTHQEYEPVEVEIEEVEGREGE